MSLAFLTPDVAGDGAGDAVVARSPMEPLARAAGARMEQREGWNVAIAYPDAARERELLTERVVFADRSHLLKLELQANPGALAAIVATASGGHALEPGRAVRAEGAWWCPVTPTRVLALGELEDGARIRAAVAAAAEDVSGTVTSLDVSGTVTSSDVSGTVTSLDVSGTVTSLDVSGTVTVTDLTCGLAALALAGPGARELLARFCAIDARPAAMPVGAFRPGSVARTPGYVLCDGDERLLVLVGWALGHYLWTVVADAAGHLGGGPVGVDALGV